MSWIGWDEADKQVQTVLSLDPLSSLELELFVIKANGSLYKQVKKYL